MSYDAWVADEGYRAAKLAELDLPVRDNSLGRTASYGGGSSFAGRGQVAARDVTERWRSMAGDALYRALVERTLADPERRALLEQFYPESACAAADALA